MENLIQPMIFNIGLGKCFGYRIDCKIFNEPVKITGFVGGRNGDYIIEVLDNMDIDHSFVPISEETRLLLE